jgi:hypothetical protein
MNFTTSTERSWKTLTSEDPKTKSKSKSKASTRSAAQTTNKSRPRSQAAPSTLDKGGLTPAQKDNFIEGAKTRIPLGRTGTAAEVAAAALYLAADLPTPPRNAGTSTRMTCTSARLRSDQAIRPKPPVKISLTLREQEAGAGCIMKGENPMPNLEEAIRERAYHLWIADGQPEGQADIYWLNAQREILTTSVAPTDTGSVATKPGKKARVARAGKSKARAA